MTDPWDEVGIFTYMNSVDFYGINIRIGKYMVNIQQSSTMDNNTALP